MGVGIGESGGDRGRWEGGCGIGGGAREEKG